MKRDRKRLTVRREIVRTLLANVRGAVDMLVSGEQACNATHETCAHVFVSGKYACNATLETCAHPDMGPSNIVKK